LAEARIIADRVTGASGTGSLKHGLMLAVTDPKTWFFVSHIPLCHRITELISRLS